LIIIINIALLFLYCFLYQNVERCIGKCSTFNFCLAHTRLIRTFCREISSYRCLPGSFSSATKHYRSIHRFVIHILTKVLYLMRDAIASCTFLIHVPLILFIIILLQLLPMLHFNARSICRLTLLLEYCWTTFKTIFRMLLNYTVDLSFNSTT